MSTSVEEIKYIVQRTEATVLGHCLLGARQAAEVVQAIGPEHFVNSNNRTVFYAINGALQSSERVDIATVADHLAKTGHLDEIGGAVYLHTLMESAPFGSVSPDIDRIRSMHLRRVVMKAATDILADVQDLSADALDIHGTAITKLTASLVGFENRLGIAEPSEEHTIKSWNGELDDGKAHRVGIEGVDDLYSVKRGQMTVITGHPNGGKTTWTGAALAALAKKHDWKFLVWSAEHHISDAMAKIAAPYLGCPVVQKPGRRVATHDAKVEAFRFITEHFRFIEAQSTTVASLDTILAIAKIVMATWPFDGIVIDPWTELDTRRPGNWNETEAHKNMISAFRSFIRSTDTHGFIVAHPTKGVQLDTVPTLKDISGTAHFHNKADFGVSIHRPALDPQAVMMDPNLVEFVVTKCRDDSAGSLGQRQLRWSPDTTRFKKYMSQSSAV